MIKKNKKVKKLKPGEIILPEPTLINYDYNPSTQNYHLQQKPENFNGLPEQLIITKAAKENIKRYADRVIQSPTINGVKTFHTLMERLIPFDNVFTGDDKYQKPDKNLILFIFSPSWKRLIILYFEGYFPKNQKEKKEVMTVYMKRLESL